MSHTRFPPYHTPPCGQYGRDHIPKGTINKGNPPRNQNPARGGTPKKSTRLGLPAPVPQGPIRQTKGGHRRHPPILWPPAARPAPVLALGSSEPPRMKSYAPAIGESVESEPTPGMRIRPGPPAEGVKWPKGRWTVSPEGITGFGPGKTGRPMQGETGHGMHNETCQYGERARLV